MKPRCFVLFLGLFLAGLADFPCRAEGPELTLDAVLEKWEKASKECKILDAKLKLFHYDDILITAIPKKDHQALLPYSKIRILLDTEDYRTKALQYIHRGEKNYDSIVLYDQKVNEKPKDRDRVIEPDLSGFRAMEWIVW